MDSGEQLGQEIFQMLDKVKLCSLCLLKDYTKTMATDTFLTLCK